MKKVLTIMIVLGFFLTAFCVPVVLAGEHGKAKECGKEWKSKDGHKDEGLEKMFYDKAHMILKNDKELGLTDEQKAKIKDMKTQVKKDLVTKDAEIDVAAVDMKSKLCGDTVDTEGLNKAIDQKYDLKKARAKYVVGACAQLKDVLTKEQNDKLKELCSSHKEHKKS